MIIEEIGQTYERLQGLRRRVGSMEPSDYWHRRMEGYLEGACKNLEKAVRASLSTRAREENSRVIHPS